MNKITLYAYRIFSPLMVFLQFVSCSGFFDTKTETVDFYLPAWPPLISETDSSPIYPALSRWQISVRSADESKDFSLSSGAQKITLAVSKNEPCVVCASPVTLNPDGSETAFFKMAGAVYPYYETKLSWECGFTSSIIKRIVDNKADYKVSDEELRIFLKQFNWKKMQDGISEKIAESILEFENQDDGANPKFYNPWQIDSSALIEVLSSASFASSYLDTKYIFSIDLDSVLSSAGFTYETDTLLSSFIPQNQIIKKYGKAALKKNIDEYFMTEDGYALKLTAVSAKNVSASLTYLPIIIDEYDYP